MNKKISKLGLGTSNIASLGKSLPYNKAKRLFDLAFDMNVSTIDTSDTYGSGDAERLIGKIIEDKRNNIFIISKVGYPYITLPKSMSPLNQFGKKILQGLKFKKRFKKKYIFGQQLVKLNLRFNPIDFKTILKSHEYLIKKINKLKIGNFQKKYDKKFLMQLLKKQIKNFNSIAHHIGTTRMGSSKKNGVVDKNCKVFGINNLFIAGSSVFPTSGHANPTLTIVALSLRLSNFLKKSYNAK